MTRIAPALLSVGLLAAGACATPPSEERSVFAAPDRHQFQPVGDVFGSHCGSLDCHGDSARNLRIYSTNGLRLEGVPGFGLTTEAEYGSSYDSLIAIDPEGLAVVVSEGGIGSERWIVVSKGLGREAHEGGVAMAPGSAADGCVTSWLAGVLDEAACAAAAEILPPGTE
jgi:hypothetical protein